MARLGQHCRAHSSDSPSPTAYPGPSWATFLTTDHDNIAHFIIGRAFPAAVGAIFIVLSASGPASIVPASYQCIHVQHALNPHPFLLSISPELRPHSPYPTPLLVSPLSPSNMPRVARRLRRGRGSWEGQYIRLQVIGGHNINVPSKRIPAGIYVAIKFDKMKRWNSAVRVLSSDNSVAWGDSVTLSPDASPSLSLEIRASFELGRMLGHGELVGTLETSWHKVLDHRDEPFDLSFQPIDDICPTLTLKAVSVHACGNEDIGLFDPPLTEHKLQTVADSEITRRTDEGHARFRKYMRSQHTSQLNRSVNNFQWVLDQCPVGHPDRAAALTNLAWARLQGYIRNDLPDIDSTTALLRDALALRPQGHPDHPLSLYHLTVVLAWRHQDQKTTTAIRECAQLYHELGTYFCNITAGDKLVDYVIQACNNLPRDTSDEGIQLRRIVLEHCPRGCICALLDMNIVIYHWTTLSERPPRPFPRQHSNIDDINRAISLYREALTLLSTWASNYMHELDTSEDLDEAINLFRESLRLRQLDHPERHTPHSRLSKSHHTALRWVDAAEDHEHESVVEAYHTCLDLFDNHVMTRSSIISRRDAATAFYGAQSLPVDAASCTIRRNDLQRAVELVEQGRGQQWSLASRLRTPLEDLASASPPLAHSLSELSSTDSAAADRAAIEYRRLTKEWDAAVAEVHSIQGFSRFLLPPSYEELQAAAQLWASHHPQCQQILLGAAPCSLPISHSRVSRDAARITLPWRYGWQLDMGPTEPRKDLRALLRQVWEQIMLPIIDVLKHDLELQDRSRIWLCPTAAFTSIPLHAANPFRKNSNRSGMEPSLEDLYICSYTPTLSALIRSRQMMKMRAETPCFVAIGQSQPGAGQGKMLAAVDSELELVHKLTPPNAKFTTLSGDDATRAGALDALRRNTWVHLACHGKQDHQQPYHSRFSMRDEPLTLLDIMENDTPHAEFAFLSACHTAVGDEKTPDEVIHLAAGLQFSGFKSVIGTLWAVDDAVTKHVVEAFYENMFKEGVIDCTRAASSLNYATDTVKKIIPLEQKIVFVHIGV
ncbi:CHAT domain-containing protein [Suillus paluster]|uniref:CHAT domain-containing protein n=1 Tax=Suillus paluster TaxID=48578 RepID=UPI001B8611BA|nr:CHAT domain-containing protein [Suillus paluster]KAG1730554.1 CHAT domain-containing protein [Suillus paluster]